VTAWVEDKDHGFEVMGLQHREYPVHGVQFHPESFLTVKGYDLLQNFLNIPHSQKALTEVATADRRLSSRRADCLPE
jgi:anthranilate synthase component 2